MAATLELEPLVVKLAWNAELDAIVTRLATKAGKPKEEWLRRLLLDAIEDAEDSADAEEVMTRIRSGDERTYTSEEVRRRLGLDD